MRTTSAARAVPSDAAAAPKNEPVARTRTSRTFASLRSAILSATRIASRSNPEPSVGTIITLYIKDSLLCYARGFTAHSRPGTINLGITVAPPSRCKADFLSVFPCLFLAVDLANPEPVIPHGKSSRRIGDCRPGWSGMETPAPIARVSASACSRRTLTGSPGSALDRLEDSSEPRFHVLGERADLLVTGKL